MTTHYNIHIISSQTDLKVTYRDTKFRKLEHLRGKLSQDMLDALGKVVPIKETDFDKFMKKYQGVISYTPERAKPKSLYTHFLDEWYTFYKDFVGLTPKFTGADGKALKQIISYLKNLGGTEQEALILWQLILSKWNTLDKFHQKKTDLKYINSQLNIILINVKGINKTDKQVFTSATTSEIGKNFKF